MMQRLLAVSVITIGIVVVLVFVTRSNADRLAAAPEQPDQCRPLDSSSVATLQLYLPSGWTFGRTAVTDSPDRTRDTDGAPVSFVAAWVLDADGRRATDEPALFVWEGGTSRRHDELPKSHYVLNDAAARVARHDADAGAGADVRRAVTDARTLAQPYSDTDPTALAAVACLR